MKIKVWIASPSQTGKQTEFPVSEKPVLIGRTAGQLRVDDVRCSRMHAALAVKADGTVWLRDLDSSNGTYLRGKKIRETQITAGTEIRIGQTNIIILSIETPAEEETSPRADLITAWPEYFECLPQNKA